MTMTMERQPDFAAMRTAMVASQLRTNAVSDARVVAAMAVVPRERFVPEEKAPFAYRDDLVALGGGRSLNLPIATGRLLTEARLLPSDRVLLIGAATGYTAAVLAELVASVVAVEVDPALVTQARAALGTSDRIAIVEGPLEAGHPEGAPYDVMIIDGAVEQLPEQLVAQVRTGGRIVGGLNDNGVTRLATGRRSEGGFAMIDFADVNCCLLPGFAKPTRFTF
ncbi:protein-L-isoaspartate(D-aspartate) O-methyltransferase [Sphingomonas sp. OV641]|uniref:protein-L-isoaspartate O-methyltransferase family protein n=1 Tax=unclassified Sphingomonas TaxID=196159 RepID=UPI000832F26C|nr:MULTISPECIES: methyltransferase domain-containing protein [unclassified Sphingomonas]SEJ33016.1 protein-L-isoaspartate(D-aspartate) O-methyltransferase [Sphingomonas sp. OV641]